MGCVSFVALKIEGFNTDVHLFAKLTYSVILFS